MKMQCESCAADLIEFETKENDNRHMIAARAQNAGITVKNFLRLSDESGYHYFCGKVCSDEFKAKITK